MSKIIGIDLGSTNSAVAVMENGVPTVIINDEGGRTTPSVISIKGEETKVGASANRAAALNPKTTVKIIKRFMGGTYDEVKEHISHVQYDVENVDGTPRVKIEDKYYSPEELSAKILQKMKKTAEDYLGETVTDAVITVPAYFSDAARAATKVAGEIAGLNVRRIVAEPTAAVLASDIDRKNGGKFMVVDDGGSTTDVSVVDVADDVVEVLSSYGDVYCGGSDIDKALCEYIVSEFKTSNGVNLANDAMAMGRVVEACEKAKIELSNTLTTEINLPYITAVDGAPVHLVQTVTRAKFETLVDDHVKKVINCAKEALNKAKLTSKDISTILLVGGTTRIPYLQNALEKEFGVSLNKSLNPDEAVAQGAAVQAGILAGEVTDILLVDVTPLSLGIDTMGGVMATIVEANTTIPCSRSQIFTTAVDNQPAVTIVVAQGNRPMTADNKQIGLFNLDGIAPARRGVPQIEVTFDIDANGILSVSAVDKGTGKEQKITIESKGGLTDDEIARMKKDAEEHAEKDKEAKERAEKFNAADSYAFMLEKTLDELGDKITEEQKNSVTEKITSLREALKTNELDKVESAQKELENVWNPIAEEMYKSQTPNDGAANPDMSNMFGGANPFAGSGDNNPFAKM